MSTPTSATRPARLVAALMLFLGLMGFGGQAFAVSDPTPPYFALSVDDTTLTPGQGATLSVTFTNRQATPVTFLYATVFASEWGSPPSTAVHREITGCSGASWCDFGPTSVRFNLVAPSVPIAPGDSRTVTLPFRFTADSDCTAGALVGFHVYYFYYEYAQGTYQGGEVPNPPAVSSLVCPPAP
ncbi:hypothetical protein ACFVFS_11410 [Kitasatospora sp. NPDC057692]|uniref:hypothetical protein n=1 Tax=Kitasatospora sp. NPDC057692 TaxID=3346215 RepID=UPI003676CBF6